MEGAFKAMEEERYSPSTTHQNCGRFSSDEHRLILGAAYSKFDSIQKQGCFFELSGVAI
jgi:hypothetical protein